jgi:hypothetical protein
MKRDMDLVRQILLEVEKLSFTNNVVEISLEGYTSEEINYHLIILADAGLLAVDYVRAGKKDYIWKSIRLTWDGHEFLDAARDNNRWEKAKGTMQKAGGFVLPVLMQLLTQYLKAELKLP